MCKRCDSMCRRAAIILLGVVLCIFPCLFSPRAGAQSGDVDWSTPVNLFPPYEIGGTGPQNIVADSSGAAHLFWGYTYTDGPFQEGYIYYARWDGVSWSEPLDILYSPEGRCAAGPLCIVDPKTGVLHLMWIGEKIGRQDPRTYYSRAHASDAGSVHAWTPPVVFPYIPYEASDPFFTIDQDGIWHVIYTQETGDHWTIYYIKSTDGGHNWSEPSPVEYETPVSTQIIHKSMQIDGRGRLHTTWAEYAIGGRNLFYARSLDGGQTWTPPLEVASGYYQSLEIAITDQNTIHLLWNGSAGDRGRYHQWSSDGGETWSAPVRFMHTSGYAGGPSTVLDSAGILHLATTTGGAGIALSTYWNGTNWAEPRQIVYGDYTEHAKLAITEGNRLIVCGIGRTKGYDEFNAIWCATGRTSAPFVPPKPLPTPAPTPTLPPTLTTVPTQTPTATPQSNPGVSSIDTTPYPDDTVRTNPWHQLMAGILPVTLVIAVVIFTRVARHRRNW